jgi:hypothetical protein
MLPKKRNKISYCQTALERQYYRDQKPLFILTSCSKLLSTYPPWLFDYSSQLVKFLITVMLDFPLRVGGNPRCKALPRKR